jgi:hypothetical protein
MATCMKCGNTHFQTEPVILLGGSKKAAIVCCSQCNSAIGVIDSEEINQKIDKISDAIRQIANKLGIIIVI